MLEAIKLFVDTLPRNAAGKVLRSRSGAVWTPLDSVAGTFPESTIDFTADGGVVFKLSPNSDGSWTYRVLHVFRGTPALQPSARLVLDKAGNLYGTTSACASGRRKPSCRAWPE